jgi:hypothetical protein
MLEGKITPKQKQGILKPMEYAGASIPLYRMNFMLLFLEKKIYSSIEEMQKNVDEWIAFYNNERTHTGKYCFGKTPMQTFYNSIAIAKKNATFTRQLIF